MYQNGAETYTFARHVYKFQKCTDGGVQNCWLAPSLTQPFTLPRSIK